MNECILDSSALLAIFNEESGADLVEKVLPYSIMSTINVSEVIAVLENRLGILPSEGSKLVDVAVAKIIAFDTVHAIKTAALRKKTAQWGFSLGDRACIALGMHLSLPVYTADRAWKNFSIPQGIVLIR